MLPVDFSTRLHSINRTAMNAMYAASFSDAQTSTALITAKTGG